MAVNNKLSIYLIKEEFNDDQEIVENYDTSELIEGVGTVYLGSSYISKPKWASTFLKHKVDTDKLFISNARAVLLVHINVCMHSDTMQSKVFAVVMGYGKSMLKENVIEERFGMKVILNTIDPNSLRRINKRDIGGNQKLSNEQLPIKASVTDFGLDINRDLVSYIAGVSNDEEFATGIIAGGDILSLTAKIDVDGIPEFLQRVYDRYMLNRYREHFSWIDQIQDVKDTRLINQLNKKAIDLINNASCDIWMAVPDIIDWTEIKGFQYYGKKLYDDIFIDKVKDSFTSGLTEYKQLKEKQIVAISTLDDSKKYTWSANRCVFGEVTVDDKAYCINNGKWYCIDMDFVKQIRDDYASSHITPIDFAEFTESHINEANYNSDFVNNRKKDYLLMDRQIIPFGGGYSRIELCDILSAKNELIHIKPYSGSATLSHLFNQGAVSAELLVSDDGFLAKANDKIENISNNADFNITNSRNIKVVYGIITKNKEPLPQIPFFSMVAFKNVKRHLKAYGVNVSIKGIVKSVSA